MASVVNMCNSALNLLGASTIAALISVAQSISNSATATVPSAKDVVPVTFNAPATVNVAPDGTVKVSPESPTVIDVPVFGLILSTFTSLI